MTATRAREHNWLSSTPSIIYNQPVERTSFFLAIILDSWNPSPYSLDRESIVKYSYIMDSLPAISAGTFLIMVWHTSINQAIVCPIIAVVFSYEFSREQQHCPSSSSQSVPFSWERLLCFGHASHAHFSSFMLMFQHLV